MRFESGFHPCLVPCFLFCYEELGHSDTEVTNIPNGACTSGILGIRMGSSAYGPQIASTGDMASELHPHVSHGNHGEGLSC